MYEVYIVECADGTLYTGITNALERRIEEHNASDKGAKYTRSRRPVKLVYQETHSDRSAASKREYEIKKMPREKKKELLS
jgi:putative endonuclease